MTRVKLFPARIPIGYVKVDQSGQYLVYGSKDLLNAFRLVEQSVNAVESGLTALEITNIPAGAISSTDVQNALNELDTEKQPKDATLTAFAGLTITANKVPYGTGVDVFGTLDLDTDGALAANSDTKLATQKATKTYVDGIIAAQDAMVFKGVIDCSANPSYPAADRGHTYRASVAGKIGGAAGVNVEVGDFMMCLTDGTAAGNQATVGASWAVFQANLDGAVVGPASAVSGNIATFNGVSGKTIQDGGKALPTGSIVGTSDSQILTNKTLTAPVIATISNTGTLTLPTSTDTLVGKATSDILTNKTLTSPVINTPTGTMTLASGVLGYSAGNGGTVTQLTDKSTGVTLSKIAGEITLNAAALAANTTVSFTLTNTTIAATDVLILNHVSGGTAGSYTLNAQGGAGSASINVRNVTGGSLSEAIVIRFAVIKAATS